jgi:hypothetical protein
MITFFNTFTNIYALAINFLAYSLIFLGACYVALQNRKLPQWHVTPLWYVGLSSLLTLITIFVQWVVGPQHPLSYYNLGSLSETLVNISVAAVATIMLVVTVKRDIKLAKYRRSMENN